MRFSVTRDTSQVTDMTMRDAVTLHRDISIEANSVCQTLRNEYCDCSRQLIGERFSRRMNEPCERASDATV